MKVNHASIHTDPTPDDVLVDLNGVCEMFEDDGVEFPLVFLFIKESGVFQGLVSISLP